MPMRFGARGPLVNSFFASWFGGTVARSGYKVEAGIGSNQTGSRSSSGVAYAIFKRTFDCTTALLTLVLLLPLMVFVSVLLIVTQGRPLLIRHSRIGKHAVPFQCLKFRSMVRDADHVLARHLDECLSARAEWNETRKLRSDPRVTTIGRVLRRSSLDELPQLINIVKGDMSVVGPRPIVSSELRLYGTSIGQYYKVRPGLTGLWQVSGRSNTTYETRVVLDCEYVRTKSIVGDIKIIVKTIPAVLTAGGSY